MAFKTPQEILQSSDFMAQRQRTARYVQHEHQDLGYRLAVELGDLPHRHIYMSLAKRYPQYLLEKILSIVKDAGSVNRGPLFMWHLKKMRQELADAKLKQDFSLETINKQMATVADLFATTKFKHAHGIEPEWSGLLSQLNLSGKDNALITDADAGTLPGVLIGKCSKVLTWELSRKLADLMRTNYPAYKISHTKNWRLWLNKINRRTNLIWLGKTWSNLLPLELEKDVLMSLASLLPRHAQLVMHVRSGDTSKQEWVQQEVAGQQVYVFNKYNHDVINFTRQTGWELQHQQDSWLIWRTV